MEKQKSTKQEFDETVKNVNQVIGEDLKTFLVIACKEDPQDKKKIEIVIALKGSDKDLHTILVDQSKRYLPFRILILDVVREIYRNELFGRDVEKGLK